MTVSTVPQLTRQNAVAYNRITAVTLGDMAMLPQYPQYNAMHRMQRELGEITTRRWAAETALSGRFRPDSLKMVDRELANFHTATMNGTDDTIKGIEVAAVQATLIYYALKAWKEGQDAKDSGKFGEDAWKHSKRNKTRIIDVMDNILERYVRVALAYAHGRLPLTSQQAFAWQRAQRDKQFYDLFKGARMVAKSSFLTGQLTAAVQTGASVSGLDTVASGLADQASSAGQNLLAQGATQVYNGANLAANAITKSNFAHSFAARVGYMMSPGGCGTDATASIIAEAIKGLGIAQVVMEGWMTTVASHIGSFLTTVLDFTGLSIVRDLAGVAKSLYEAFGAYMDNKKAVRNSYMVRGGAVSHAYLQITQFWKDEMKESLADAGKKLASIAITAVCGALGAAGQAVLVVGKIAMKVYEAGKAIWEKIKSVIDVAKEMIESKTFLAGLKQGEGNDTKTMFDKSPLLACHMFLSLGASEIVSLDSKMAALSGYMDAIQRMVGEISPVVDKAAEFVKDSNFIFVREDNSPLPLFAKINNPTVREQIKAALADAAGAVKDAAVDALGAPLAPLMDAASSARDGVLGRLSPSLVPAS